MRPVCDAVRAGPVMFGLPLRDPCATTNEGRTGHDDQDPVHALARLRDHRARGWRSRPPTGGRPSSAGCSRWSRSRSSTGWSAGCSASTVIDQQTIARVLVPGAAGPAIDPAELPRLLAGPLAVGLVSIVAKLVPRRQRDRGPARDARSRCRWVLRSRAARVRGGPAGRDGPARARSPRRWRSARLGLIVLLAASPCWPTSRSGSSSGRSRSSTARASPAASPRRGRSRRGRSCGCWAGGSAVFGISLLLLAAGLLVSLLLLAVPVVPGRDQRSAIDTSFAAFSAIVLAVLYESQRLRTLAGAVVPSAPVTYPGDADGPLEPPPPPPSPPSDPWAG